MQLTSLCEISMCENTYRLKNKHSLTDCARCSGVLYRLELLNPILADSLLETVTVVQHADDGSINQAVCYSCCVSVSVHVRSLAGINQCDRDIMRHDLLPIEDHPNIFNSFGHQNDRRPPPIAIPFAMILASYRCQEQSNVNRVLLAFNLSLFRQHSRRSAVS